MIKNTLMAIVALLLLAFSGDGPYHDGTYHGISRAGYTDEPYYGFSEVTIDSGKIVQVVFFIRDSARHELLNENYQKYFAGNEEYIRQCINDCKGIRSYPGSLLKYQDLNKIDAMTGATWSYNIFKASVRQALSTAEKDE